jgi:aspartate aminotransferase
MPSFARHAGQLAESETLVITARANALRAQGIEVAPFAAGEPDFPTPSHICEAAIAAIRAGRTKYTPTAGIAPLREAVAARMRARGYAGVTPERTMVGVGAKGVLFLALEVLLEEGDEAIVPSPCWLSYGKMIEAAGARPVYVATRPEDGYALDPERVRAALTPRTKVILVNSPGNPTGAVLSDEAQRAVGRIALERGLTVVSDEIYEDLVYAPARFRSFAALCPEANDLTLVVSGVSKAYAMTGWRIGYAAGPKDLIQRIVRLQSHALSAPPDICQAAALAALTGPQQDVEAMRGVFERRRDLLHAGLAALPGLTCRRPDGAFYALPDVSRWFALRFEGQPVGNASRLGELLLEHARVAVVPGDPFEAPYAIRFSYACSGEDIRRGLARIGDFASRLQG